MNTKMKRNTLMLILGLLCLSTAQAHDSTRLNNLMWTDRNATNPPLSRPESTINSSIERFWNLPESPTPVRRSTAQPRCAPRPHYHPSHSCNPRNNPPAKNRLVQDQNSRERRGHFGINLFNMIPLIDIVHGSSESSNSDHVEASK